MPGRGGARTTLKTNHPISEQNPLNQLPLSPSKPPRAGDARILVIRACSTSRRKPESRGAVQSGIRLRHGPFTAPMTGCAHVPNKKKVEEFVCEITIGNATGITNEPQALQNLHESTKPDLCEGAF